MIREWRLSRFKSVEGTATLPFRPITILAGPNSSGKSSVIQSILLVAQSLASRVPDRQLVLNGEHVRLGTFADVRNQQADESSIEFGFAVDLDLSDSEATLTRSRDSYLASFLRPMGAEVSELAVFGDLAFGPAGAAAEGSSSPLHAEVKSASFRTTIRGQQATLFPGDEEHTNAPDVIIERRTDTQVEQLLSTIDTSAVTENISSLRQALRYSLQLSPRARQSLRRGRSDVQMQDAPGEIVATRLQHFLPATLVMKQHALQRIVSSSVRRIGTLSATQLDAVLERWSSSPDAPRAALAAAIKELATQKVETVAHYVRSLRVPRTDPEPIKELLKRTEALAGDPWPSAMTAVETPLPEEQALAFEGLHTFFDGIRYLGPLRDDPKPLYAMSGAVDPSDVGSKGQYTAAVLDVNAPVEIEFVAPGASTTSKARFSEAILLWLQHFGMADAIRTSDEPKLGHRLLVRPTGIRTYVDLTNVGVGVSQVLPILVMALISAPGSVLLFEQPELHLHPAVQSQLGDFFIAVARSGRQCVVETHSEYLINRLRLRIAESEQSSGLQELAIVHFVERPGAASKFTPVVINTFGAIPEWPRGFFDQSPNESEAILRAAVKKKAAIAATQKNERG